MKIYPGSTDQSGRLFQGDPFSISERNVFETFDVGYLARWANIEIEKKKNATIMIDLLHRDLLETTSKMKVVVPSTRCRRKKMFFSTHDEFCVLAMILEVDTYKSYPNVFRENSIFGVKLHEFASTCALKGNSARQNSNL